MLCNRHAECITFQLSVPISKHTQMHLVAPKRISVGEVGDNR